MPVTDSVETFDANSNEVIDDYEIFDDNEVIDDNEVMDENDMSRNNGVEENNKSPDPDPEDGSGGQTQAFFLLTAITVSLLF